MEGVSPSHLFVINLTLADQSLHSDNELTLFIHDALQFISAFIVPISQRAPHFYLSALPLAPEKSHVARKFCPRVPNTLAITQGKPSQWPMVVFTAEHHVDEVNNIVFSLDESTFASISFYDMYVCDSETGHCISGPIATFAVVWDIETGEEQFQVKGSNFAFIHHDGRIASTHLVDEDGNSHNSKNEGSTCLLVQLWDASNGALINRLFEVKDVAVTRFSPNGHFLAIGRKSEDVIKLWNLEDGKDLRRFAYPHGNLTSLHFSPTSNTLMAVFREEPCHIHLWRLDTQEMVSFNHDFNYGLHVIHSSTTNYLFIERYRSVEIWDVSTTDSKMI